jgi:multidrug transporter EmrE-like cation transporter
MMPERPTGVTAVAIAFLLAAAYLLVVALTMLVRPGLVSMAAGAELLGGLELAGPYMFLLVAGVGLAVAFGLLRLQRWARWMAILIAMIGMVLLLPSVSSALIDFRFGRLVWGGLGVIVRSMIVWYLFQEPVKEAFLARS